MNQKILKYKTNSNFHPHTPSQSSNFKSKKLKSTSLDHHNNQPRDIITQVPQSYQSSFLTRPISLTPSNRIIRTGAKALLPPKSQKYINKKTLILDLDETLVHSSFMPFERSDLILRVDFDEAIYSIFVLIRPEVEVFLKEISEYFEIVIFTASLSKYASPLIDKLDKKGVCEFKLFREHCSFINGLYVKDLRKMNRELKDLIIVDNSPISYAFSMENGLPIKSWFSDKKDRELMKLLPILKFLSKVNDVREYIPKFVKEGTIEYSKANRIINEILSREEKENNNILSNDNNTDNIKTFEIANEDNEKNNNENNKEENEKISSIKLTKKDKKNRDIIKKGKSPNIHLISKKNNFTSFRATNDRGEFNQDISNKDNNQKPIKSKKIEYLLKSANTNNQNIQTPLSSFNIYGNKSQNKDMNENSKNIQINYKNSFFPIKLKDNQSTKYSFLLDGKNNSSFPSIITPNLLSINQKKSTDNPLSLSQRLKLNQKGSIKLKLSNSFKYLTPNNGNSNNIGKLTSNKMIRSKSTGKYTNYYQKPQTPKTRVIFVKQSIDIYEEPKTTKNMREKTQKRLESARFGMQKF